MEKGQSLGQGQPKENQQELMFKLSMFEQQIQQLQQQLQAIDQGIFEMNGLSNGLNELVGSVDKEILASIGRGVFVKTKLLSEDLIVDIGNKTFVKKNIPEAQELIREQIEKLNDVKKELEYNLEKIGEEMMKMYEEGKE